MNPSAPRRSHSPTAIVNVIALTIATVVAGAWDVGCHDHDAPTASYAWCAIDHEAEAAGAPNHASLGAAPAPREHSCVACRLGCSKTAAVGGSFVARPLDPASAAARSENDGGSSRGALSRQTARGPPPG